MFSHSFESRYGESFVRFVVPLPDRNPVHMSFKLLEHMAERRAIVIVQAEKFVQLWRDDPSSIHREQACGNEQTWRTDYKFHHAENGFSHGQDNPVPLAYVSFGENARTLVTYRYLWFGRSEREILVPNVGFTNGVTRTIWLLANQCPVFPIECDLPGAKELQRIAGAPSSSLLTIDALLESYRASSAFNRDIDNAP